MAEFVFTSPGYKFRERDLSFVTRNVGVTTLGIVGETVKGPAFEPVFVQDKGQFRTRFGDQNIEKFPNNGELRYQLPYAANAYLNESNQGWVTRVLGLSGYDAGTAWAITLSAGVDEDTIGEVSEVTNSGVTFTGGTYLGVGLSATGQTGTSFNGFTKVGSVFTGTRHDFVVVTYSASTISGTVDDTLVTLSAASQTELEGMVLAVIRSRGEVTDHEDAIATTRFDTDTLTMTANDTNTGTGDMFGNFELTAFKAADLEDPDPSTEIFTVSLDPNAADFLPSVIGSEPKSKNAKIWCERTYPDLIRLLDANGGGYGFNTVMIDADSSVFTDYQDQFQTPETPWVVSQLKGSDVDRLFKFISISDGDNANKEIKISITNIDPISKEFSVVVRDFNDTDANPIVIESFLRCVMRKGETNYIGNRIGTSNGEYILQSEYIMLELNENAENDTFPAGFEGFIQNDWAASATTASAEGITPSILYKTSYLPDERLNRVSLGISETAYSIENFVNTAGIDQNHFNYRGKGSPAKSKGFHMDSGATGIYYDGNMLLGEFEVGAGRFRTSGDIQAGDVYEDERSRKFTLVPAGGFDGWDENRGSRSNTDEFRKGGWADGVEDGLTPHNDFQAWETAIATFGNPEEVTINIFATPGIDFGWNTVIVQDTIEMMENQRTDTLYVIDSPDVDVPVEIGERADNIAAKEIVDLLENTAIDSSYACTYFPWIQIPDTQNNVNVWLPPTGEVLKAMAYTDNVKFPWYAPAGLQRGVTDARRSKYRMSQDSRDILYAGRINPMADFSDVGTAIFGQKTLQFKESALDRINVRRLLLQIKVLIANISSKLLFEQNDQATVDEFLSKANPVLDSIRRERGLTEFRIKMDDSNNSPESRDRNELYGEIFLKPTKSLEFIGITFTITPEGASFDDL